MKKHLYIQSLALAVCLAAGCEKAAVEQPELISFTAAVAPAQTKSTTLTAGTLGTYAWKTSEFWESTAEASRLSNPYIVNAETTYSSSAWHPGTYRWPASGYLHFICYGPYKVSSPITYSTSGLEIKDYTVGTDDLVYSSTVTNRTSATSTSIELSHALSMVQVKIQADAAPSGVSSAIKTATVTLTSLSLDSLKTKGTFSGSSSTWASLSGKENKSLFSGSKTLSTTLDSSTVPSVYVMPQQFEDKLQAVRLSYTVDITYTNDTNTSATFNDEIHYLKGLTTATGWEPGKCTVYTITLSAFSGKVSLSASTESWSSKSASGDLGGGR